MKKNKTAGMIYLTVTAWCTAIMLIFVFSFMPAYKTYSGINAEISEAANAKDDFSAAEIKGKSYINVLMVGLDKDETRTDVIMVAQFNLKNSSVRFLHIPRDTYVDKKGDKKINSSYGAGGIERTIKDIQKIVDIDIDRHVIITTSGFKDVVDEVGGVWFDVPQNMDYEDPYQDLFIHLKKGYQHLDGSEAEQLVRFRSYPQGDLARIEVQSSFIKEAIEQIIQKCNDGEADSTNLINEVLDMVETDFGVFEAVKYAPYLLRVDMDNVNSIRIAGEAKMLHGVSYFVADDKENRKIIDEYFSPDSMLIDYSEIEIRDNAIGKSPAEHNITSSDLGDGKVPVGTTVDILDFSGTNGASLQKAKSVLESSGCKVIGTFEAKTITVDKTMCISGDNNLVCPKVANVMGLDRCYINPDHSVNASIVVILGKDVSER